MSKNKENIINNILAHRVFGEKRNNLTYAQRLIMDNQAVVGIDQATITLKAPENVSQNDWLEYCGDIIFTFMRLSEFNKLFSGFEPVDRPINGYTTTLQVPDVPYHLSISYHSERVDMGVSVKFSSQGLRAYYKRYFDVYGKYTNIAEFIQSIQSQKYITRFSRIDMYADFIDITDNDGSDCTVHNFYQHIQDGNYLIKNSDDKSVCRTISAIVTNSVVETFYINKRTSNAMIRVYDKRLEQIKTVGPYFDKANSVDMWTRAELEAKGHYANQITSHLLNIEDESELTRYIAARINDKFSFYDTNKEDYAIYTEILNEIACGYTVPKLVNFDYRNNSLRKSVNALRFHSGLYSIFLKFEECFGEGSHLVLMNYLINDYKTNYKNNIKRRASTDAWLARNKSTIIGDDINKYLYIG